MTSDINTVWNMLEGAKTGFLTTWHDDALQSRPMALTRGAMRA